jgi:iron-sulfur cluster repair protein YtfE (RIC family)
MKKVGAHFLSVVSKLLASIILAEMVMSFCCGGIGAVSEGGDGEEKEYSIRHIHTRMYT